MRGFASLLLLLASSSPVAADLGTVERDAQEVTRLALRHDQLLLKLNMRRITAAEQQEMERARADLDAIKARYAPGRVSGPVATAFSSRLRELSRDVVVPGIKLAVVEAFPEPDAVSAAFPTEPERAAAMQVLALTLGQKIGQPTIPAAAAKIARYHSAAAALNPRSRPDYTARLDAIDALRRSKKFAAEVLERFVPVYAVEAENAFRKQTYETALTSATERYRTGVAVVILMLTALPLLPLIVGQGRFQRRPVGIGGPSPLKLPPALERIHVFRKRSWLDFRYGTITDSSVSAVTYQDNRLIPGGGSSERTLVTTRCTLSSPDGTVTSLTFHSEDLDRPPARGDLYSVLLMGKHAPLAYNHTRKDFAERSAEIRKALRFGAVPLWLLSFAFAFVAFLVVERFFVTGTSLNGPLEGANLRQMIVVTPIASGIWIFVLRTPVEWIRQAQFPRRVPPLSKFLEEQTAPLARLLAREKGERG